MWTEYPHRVPGAVLNQTHCFVFSTDLCFTKEETEAQKALCHLPITAREQSGL